MAKSSGMNIAHARVKDQEDEMRRIEEDEVCPFCRKNFETYHNEPVLKEGTHWLVSKNDYPYEGTLAHILIVSKEHVTDMCNIDTGARSEFFEFVAWIREEFPNPGGTLVIRFGDTEYTGATIEHLHAHVIFGESSRINSGGKIKVKVGYKP